MNSLFFGSWRRAETYCAALQVETAVALGNFGAVDVDVAGVGGAELGDLGEGFGVNAFSEGQAFAAVFGEADDFLEPGGAGGFKVQSGIVFLDGAADGGVDGKIYSLPEWTLSFRWLSGRPYFLMAKAMTDRSSLNSFSNWATLPT